MVRNWVFLGDSLTEGVGSKRVSHVAELVKQLRSDGRVNVHEFRLRQIDADFNRQIEFNVAGLMNIDAEQKQSDLWLWNLACEGQTIESDFGWLPLIAALQPELVVIFRGSLESIIRPAMVRDGDWPWWVPQSWRGYAAMDPRCYFSTTWWRKAKQTTIDAVKQRARLKLLRSRSGKPLIDIEQFASYQAKLLERLHALGARVLVLGLLPVNDERFPGSSDHFQSVNARLKQIAAAQNVEFFDWALSLNGGELFYRDGFHPNAAGAEALAKILREHTMSRKGRKSLKMKTGISAIITAYERIEQTLATLRLIQSCVPPPDETLVHVDANQIACEKAIRDAFPRVRILRSEQQVGPGGGRNKLVEAAQFAFVASFDDDSYPLDSDYFARALQMFEKFPEASIVCAALYHAGESIGLDEKSARWTADFSGGACIFRRDAFLDAGGYVPLPVAYGMEEVDLAIRLHSRGGRF